MPWVNSATSASQLLLRSGLMVHLTTMRIMDDSFGIGRGGMGLVMLILSTRSGGGRRAERYTGAAAVPGLGLPDHASRAGNPPVAIGPQRLDGTRISDLP